MKKYKIGIIGYGGFGKFLYHWWNKMEEAQVSAVADSAGHFKKTDDCSWYENWEDLLKDPEVEIVSIVTPPGLHAHMACAAMQAGKHVLLEKPVAVTVEETEKILKVQRETGRIITVNHMIRYNPIIQALMSISESGAFGQIRHAVVNNYAQDETLPAEHWFWDEELSGGIMVEHGVHFFDIINALGRQKYTKVDGCWDNRNELQRDRVAAIVKYDKGLIASFYHAFSGPGFFEQTTINLAYDLARIEIEGWIPMKGKIKALVNKQNIALFNALPGWKETDAEPFENVKDVSRPEGWGSTGQEDVPNIESIFVGGKPYKADTMISGSFEISGTKGEVYGRSVQLIILDLIKKIENKDHQLTITLEDACEALEIAVLASK
ncbi:Gfo/Idh/MocA family protein [Flavobacterium chungbukense]|uniref:Dehydrogenase n=1 Tax=Flavobacterium chungbukense TaxID=877464 RepID=A0ABP7XM86_9FLAO|nr:Gfo/Idh/MocA family oxidoreductase [Flavobacterium chungbukense]MCC4920694.1 Gfo/Idh/MocA family oxidoreductase [Flavobacterium chungbukense]